MQLKISRKRCIICFIQMLENGKLNKCITHQFLKI